MSNRGSFYKTMRRVVRVAMITSLWSYSYAGLADIRPPYVLNHILTDSLHEKGKALLYQTLDSLGGFERWQNKNGLRIQLTDEWPHWLTRLFVMPWPENKTLMQFEFMVGEENTRLTFLSGKKEGVSWGVQQWVPYSQQTDGSYQWKNDRTIKFWVPTISYFIDMPFRLYQDAHHLYYAGDTTLNNTHYERIFITWGDKKELSKKYDQYVIYIHSQTMLPDYIAYTVRDIAPFITGIVRYEQWTPIDLIFYAFEQTVVDDLSPDASILHQMHIQKIQGTDTFAKPLIPDPSQKALKEK